MDLTELKQQLTELEHIPFSYQTLLNIIIIQNERIIQLLKEHNDNTTSK